MSSGVGGRRVQVWVGDFDTPERFQAYFRANDEETEDQEGAPLSLFAAGQGALFYDPDFLETQLAPERTTDIRALLEGHSFSTSYIDAVAQAFPDDPLPINALALFFGEDLFEARSVSGPGVELRFLGTFDYDSKADSVAAERQAVVPNSILLQLESPGAVTYDGRQVRQVPIGSRGLTIGRGGVSADRPYLDLAPVEGTEGVAEVQLQIYRDDFEQWVIEDTGGNGLTSIGGTVLTLERSMPWQADQINIGPAVFRWNCIAETVSG